MITDVILNLISAILGFVVDLLPAGDTLNSNISDAFDFFFNTAGELNGIFPFNTYVTIIGLIFAIEVLIFSFGIAYRLFGFIRGTNVR